VDRKPQQQTLSIRISDAFREFLERSRQVMSSGGRGELVSTSDVAKMLLESAKEDRLDFRLEVAELQQDPTASLVAIRRKQGRHPLSRSEWVFVGQYIQTATEDLRESATPPPAHSFIIVFEALLAVRSLRTDRGAGLDRYYLGNLIVPAGSAINERQIDPEMVPQTVAALIEGLRSEPAGSKPLQAGRCLYIALRDEAISSVAELNQVLEPHVGGLYRLAARGHWMREGRPVRSLRDRRTVVGSVPTAMQGGIRLSGSISSEGEISLAFSLDERNVLYPLGSFPEIREFVAMAEQLPAAGNWSGAHFRGYAVEGAGTAPQQLACYRYRDGVVLGFSMEEWQHLRELLAAAMNSPKLRPFWEELELVYGEL
jgi:hypothetical protein